MTLGLRFPRSQARVLRAIGEEAERMGQGDISLYFKAAESAEIGEPLIVKCEARDEVERMAALFATLGCRRPAIEELNG